MTDSLLPGPLCVLPLPLLHPLSQRQAPVALLRCLAVKLARESSAPADGTHPLTTPFPRSRAMPRIPRCAHKETPKGPSRARLWLPTLVTYSITHSLAGCCDGFFPYFGGGELISSTLGPGATPSESCSTRIESYSLLSPWGARTPG